MIIEKQGSQSKIVPRNWAQQVGPYLELLHTRLDLDLPEQRFHYGVRLCPEPAHWGGLSGCTYPRLCRSLGYACPKMVFGTSLPWEDQRKFLFLARILSSAA